MQGDIAFAIEAWDFREIPVLIIGRKDLWIIAHCNMLIPPYNFATSYL